MSGSLTDYVAQQTTLESQRKSSIETKCFSVFTASLALVTLYVALSNQSQLGANLKKSTPRDFLLMALVAAVAGIALALWAARPVSYQAISSEDLEQTRRALVGADSADDGASNRPPGNEPADCTTIAPTQLADIVTPESIDDELLEAQIRDLRVARCINTRRAQFLYASLVLLGAETAGLIASLSFAASY